MTAILKTIRELDARLKRGEITPDEHTKRREALLQSSEIIDTEFETVITPRKPAPPQSDTNPASPNAIGFSIVVCLGVMGLSIGFILLFLPDLNLALTLGVTLLAALCVALFRALDD